MGRDVHSLTLSIQHFLCWSRQPLQSCEHILHSPQRSSCREETRLIQSAEKFLHERNTANTVHREALAQEKKTYFIQSAKKLFLSVKHILAQSATKFLPSTVFLSVKHISAQSAVKFLRSTENLLTQSARKLLQSSEHIRTQSSKRFLPSSEHSPSAVCTLQFSTSLFRLRPHLNSL